MPSPRLNLQRFAKIDSFFLNNFSKILLILLLFGLTFCSKPSLNPEEEQITEEQAKIIAYFKEVAFGSEFNHTLKVTHKWSKSMKVFIHGNLSLQLFNELKVVIKEVNELVTDGFNITRVQEFEQSNFQIFAGTPAEYLSQYPSSPDLVNSNWGFFSIYWNSNFQIDRGHMFINMERAKSKEQIHLLREELTQAMGLTNDSPRYPESIFYSDWTTTSKYSDIDKALIRLLYHPKMQSGMKENEAEAVLKDILATESELFNNVVSAKINTYSSYTTSTLP